MEVIGGTTPYTFSVDSGSLPTGLALNPTTGAISGTPTAKGAFTFKVKVVSGPNNDTQRLTISIDDEVST